jgi:hypothetical protein
MLLLRCPKCRNSMKYQPVAKDFFSRSKRCVYCGRNFKVGDNIVKQIDK